MTRTLRPFLRVLRGNEHISQAALDRLERREPTARVDAEMSRRALEAVVSSTGDEDIGLRAARAIEIGDFEIIEYVSVSAPTLRDALEALVRYRRIVDEAADLRLEARGERVHLVLGPSVPTVRAGVDYRVAAFFVAITRWLRPARASFEVHFQHAAPEDLSQYRETFGDAPIVFDAAFDGLAMATSTLELAMRTADASTHALFRVRAERLLSEVGASGNTWLGNVRAAIVAALPQGSLSAEDAAARLGLSRRTLARRLEQEGTTFSAQVRDVRRHTAEHYLRETDHGIEEIAFLLGFSEAPSFIRAFKRWLGVTPGVYRSSRQRS